MPPSLPRPPRRLVAAPPARPPGRVAAAAARARDPRALRRQVRPPPPRRAAVVPRPLRRARRREPHAAGRAQLGGNLLFTSHEHDGLRRWAAALRRAHQHAVRAMARYSSMVLVEGWLEYQGQLEEWCRAFFVLTIGGGLQCFAREPDDVTEAEAIETIALEAIVRATRSKGWTFTIGAPTSRRRGAVHPRPPRPSRAATVAQHDQRVRRRREAAAAHQEQPAVRPPTPDAAPPAVDARRLSDAPAPPPELRAARRRPRRCRRSRRR